MTELSFRAIDLADKQAAFTSLLASPIVAPWVDAARYALVTRHERDLETWCRRLGYRLQRIDRCVRLRRVPLAGQTAVPSGEVPRRRPLVLALVVASAIEDQREDSVTLQELSDFVKRGTAAYALTPYDPSQRAHRADLVAAVRRLTTHGVLEQRTLRADLLDSWEREGSGIGAGYVIHRDALVLLIDTRDAELALAADRVPSDARGPRLLRALVETQALFPEELDDDDRGYLTGQRNRLIAQAEEMTGGVVEVRSDALVLVLPSDRGLDAGLFVRFPEATAADWVALALLDAAVAGSVPDVIPGRRRCPSATVLAASSEIMTTHGSRLTVPLREGGVAGVRAAAEKKLGDAGLLTVADDGDWVLNPLAARYRAAQLTSQAAAIASVLFDPEEAS